MPRRTWLLKSDPETFGWADLLAAPGRVTVWDGVRNYQARNSLRDDVRAGDGVLFYHSQSDRAVVGTAAVTRGGFPDPTQFDRRHRGYDPQAEPAAPRWYAIEIRAAREFAHPVTLDAMRRCAALDGFALLRRGTRLSVLPVTREEYDAIVKLGGRGRAV